MNLRLLFSGLCIALSAVLGFDLLGLSALREPAIVDLLLFFVAPALLVIGLLVLAWVVLESRSDAPVSPARSTDSAWRPPESPHRKPPR